jgi:hypothetical protein
MNILNQALFIGTRLFVVLFFALVIISSCSKNRIDLFQKQYTDVYIESYFENEHLTIWINDNEVFSGNVTTTDQTGLAKVIQKVPIKRKENIIIIRRKPSDGPHACYEYRKLKISKFIYVSTLWGCVFIETSDEKRLYF